MKDLENVFKNLFAAVSHADFDVVLQERINKILIVLAKKAKEYSTRDNRMQNFEFCSIIMKAAGFESTREREALGLMNKHVANVYSIVRDQMDGVDTPITMIDEKIGDFINYLILLEACLYAEQKRIAGHNGTPGSPAK